LEAKRRHSRDYEEARPRSFCTDDTLWVFVGDQTLRGKEPPAGGWPAAYSSGAAGVDVACDLIAEGYSRQRASSRRR
jgi:hypothetical protein